MGFGADGATLVDASRTVIGDPRRRRDPTESPSRSSPDADDLRHVLPHRACEVCGEPVRVDILEGYVNGQPIRHRYCLRCAARTSAATAGQEVRTGRLRLSLLLGLAGLVLGAVALVADRLIPPGLTAGFGWHKECAVVLGALLVLVGVFSRADLVALGGLFIFGAALIAGLFGLTHVPGMGWKQQVLLWVSVGCVLLGVLGRLGLAFQVRRAVRGLRRMPRVGGYPETSQPSAPGLAGLRTEAGGTTE